MDMQAIQNETAGHALATGIAGLEKELSSMGGPPVTSRGGMVHLILSLCRQFEEAFAKAVDGGKGGGEQILRVFEERLGQNIQQLQFKKVSLMLVPTVLT